MASINGISIKNLKSITDHEGCEIWACDVWKNTPKKKKLGHAAQNYMCGPMDTDFDESELDDAIKRYAASNYVEPHFKSIINAECFLDDLVKLKRVESDWKKGIKQGYNTFVQVIIRGCIYMGYWINSKDKDSVLKSDFHKKTLKEFMSQYECKDKKQVEIKIFKEGDFDINT